NRSDADLTVGLGVSAGMAVAGNMGAPSRYEYTVIGDPVNEAARLTEVAKRSGGVTVSGAALGRAHQSEAQRWHVIESEVLRGRDNSTEIAVPSDE
ncbi:adenylate/guanylate cyclase domain-containing protein, partial [Mycobacterium sp.]|uniref:adenylate/guanylate cyclase domain-containing protein n=1 Tax=Mycobacterium sp. TaxID=1785 RepID=UPI003F81A087